MTPDQLQAHTRKQLAQLAKHQGVLGWHGMKKHELLDALIPLLSDANASSSPAPTGDDPGQAKKPAKASEPKKKKPEAAPTPAPVAQVPSDQAPVKTPSHDDPQAKKPTPREHFDEDVLRDKTKRELVAMVRQRNIRGWHGMVKEQLIQALIDFGKGLIDENTAPPSAAKPTGGSKSKADASKGDANAPKRRRSGQETIFFRDPKRNLALGSASKSRTLAQNRMVAMVRDPFWLHVYWELSEESIRRTAAALGQKWYGARPVLRVWDVTAEDFTSSAERHVRDIDIHGLVNNWYIDVANPPRTYRVDIGYLTETERFFALARSNVVATPEAGMVDQLDENWRSVREDYERIYAQSGTDNPETTSVELRDLFEERLRRPMNSDPLNWPKLSPLSESPHAQFHFDLDAELIVFGSTVPGARVSLQDKPVELRADGSFTIRCGIPEGRQILPVMATSRDGIEERTIILAIERNTKKLEPMIHDGQEL